MQKDNDDIFKHDDICVLRKGETVIPKDQLPEFKEMIKNLGKISTCNTDKIHYIDTKNSSGNLITTCAIVGVLLFVGLCLLVIL